MGAERWLFIAAQATIARFYMQLFFIFVEQMIFTQYKTAFWSENQQMAIFVGCVRFVLS